MSDDAIGDLGAARFECGACGHRVQTERHFKVCPACGADGFALLHFGPVIEGPAMSVPPGFLLRHPDARATATHTISGTTYTARGGSGGVSRFHPPEPYAPPAADLDGFSAGVLRIAWDRPAESFEIAGRAGHLYMARLVEARTRRGIIDTGMLDALLGLIVRAPDGTLSKVTGVDRFASMIQVEGTSIGILLVPVEEP